jgi:hypothetical protein
MGEHKRKSVFGILLSRLIGLTIFLIVLAVLNYMTGFVDVHIFQQVVYFLNDNILLILLVTLALLIGELFSNQIFPFNLPAPIFNATGGVFLVMFIFRILELIESLAEKNIFQIFRGLSPLAYAIVFVIVLIGGYIVIFVRLFKKEKEKEVTRAKNCEEVGDEFMQALCDLLSLLRESIKKKGGDKKP